MAAVPSSSVSTLSFALLILFLSLHLTNASIDSPATPPPVYPPPSDNSSPPAPPPPTSSGPSPTTPPTPSTTLSPSAPPNAFTPPAADEDAGESTMNDDSTGMSGGTKAGIAFGVIAFVVLAALGAFVIKKRKDNVARAHYGSTSDMV